MDRVERKEPSTGLIDTLRDEVSGTREVGVLKRIVVLRIGHSSRIEPYIDKVQFALHRLSGRGDKDDRVHIRTVEINNRRIIVSLAIVAYDMFGPWVRLHEACLHGLVYLGEQLCDRTDTDLLGAIFGAPDRQRRSPITRTGEVPVIEVIQPLTETSCSGRFGLPVDSLVEGDHLIACLGRLDKPTVERIIDDGFVGTPAMGVRVNVFLCTEETSVTFHLHTEVEIERLRFRCSSLVVLAVDGELRVIGILHPSSGILAVQVGIDVGFYPLLIEVFYLPVLTGKINHRTGTVVLGLHVKPRHAGCVTHFLIVGTKGRRDMHDTGTVFGGYIISRNHAECSFARIDPWEEGFVLEADEVSTFAFPNDLRL